MLRNLKWTEKYEEVMSDEHPVKNESTKVKFHQFEKITRDL